MMLSLVKSSYFEHSYVFEKEKQTHDLKALFLLAYEIFIVL